MLRSRSQPAMHLVAQAGNAVEAPWWSFAAIGPTLAERYIRALITDFKPAATA